MLPDNKQIRTNALKDDESPRDSRKFWGSGRLLRFVLVALTLIYIGHSVNLREFVSAFDLRSVYAILAFQIPMIVGHLCYAQRHAVLVRDPPIPLMIAFEAVLLSSALNIVTPGRIAEFVKATYLRSRLGIPLAHGLSAVLIERLFDIVVVGALAAAGTAAALNISGNLIIAIPVAGTVALLLLRPCAKLMAALLAGRSNIIARFVERQCRHIVAILRRKIVLQTVFLTVVSWLCQYFALMLFFHVLPISPLSPSTIATLFGAILFAGAIPGLPAGIGLFEAAVVFVLRSNDVPFNQALALAVALHVAELLPSAILGPVVMIRRSIGIKQLAVDAIAALKSSAR
jgi:uncharacterized protein (TIRG00374 family)